jgi:2-polyprenyl-3-methyl-5-hydroxy-6-metoxy-1,4-benzoquinol methylase
MEKDQIYNIIKKSPRGDKRRLIPELCTGRIVLDVGCVGQDHDFTSPLWMHNLIKAAAADLDGVDIDPAGILSMKEKGYSVLDPEGIKKSGKKYEVVVMSDVIEHVNDPVAFLQFYSSCLADKGIFIITTPNAHGIRNFSNILIRNNYPLNPEHTMWFCPKTILEVLRRAGLNFSDFSWLDEYYSLKEVRGVKFRLIYLFDSCMQKMRRSFSPNFLIIASK